MVPIFIFWVFTSIGCLGTWETSINDQHYLFETWGVNRIRREGGREKILSKFSREDSSKNCTHIHKTKNTAFVAVVLYRTSGRLLCMGSIVDSFHILSAKRCYEKVEHREVKVLLSCFKAYWGRNSQVIPVKKIIRHEYLLAMLRLDSPIKFGEHVAPARLPPPSTAMITDFSTVFSGPYHISGFQVDRFDVPGEYIGKDKMYQLLEDSIVEMEECKTNFTKLALEENKLFCTIGNASFCWGGLGSPVLKWMPARFYFLQVGVVVYDNCTTMETGPFLAARTDSFSDWIRGNAFQGHLPL